MSENGKPPEQRPAKITIELQSWGCRVLELGIDAVSGSPVRAMHFRATDGSIEVMIPGIAMDAAEYIAKALTAPAPSGIVLPEGGPGGLILP